jgi:hypothetical protein
LGFSFTITYGNQEISKYQEFGTVFQTHCLNHKFMVLTIRKKD